MALILRDHLGLARIARQARLDLKEPLKLSPEDRARYEARPDGDQFVVVRMQEGRPDMPTFRCRLQRVALAEATRQNNLARDRIKDKLRRAGLDPATWKDYR